MSDKTNYKNDVPETFLKFFPLNDNSLSFLQGNLYFAKTNQVNDPFEFQFNSSQIPSLFDWDKDIDTFEPFRKDSQYDSLIFCCSHPEALKNILLWSHYANNHKGFCVEFESKILKSEYLKCEYINYDEELPKPIKKGENKFSSAHSLGHIYFHKHNSWSYEKEYRAVFNISFLKSPSPTEFIRVKDKKNKINLGAIYKAPKNFIKRIYFGCQMNSTDKEKVISAAEDYNNCMVSSMMIHPEKYELVPEMFWTNIGRNKFD